MSSGKRKTWHSIVADYQRRFPHHVRLPHAQLWRIQHVDRRVLHLEQQVDFASWHEGSDRTNDFVGVWGFRCPVQACALEGWAAHCDIDWTVPAEEQLVRPPPVPASERWRSSVKSAPSIKLDNLHSVAASGRPIGIVCDNCSRRSLLSHATIGAHIGDMRAVRELRLTCNTCGAKTWRHQVFRSDEQMATFMSATT